MKIAILFSGLYSPNIKDIEVPNEEKIPKKYLQYSEKHFLEYIIDSDTDIFIHTYNSKYNNMLLETYKPKNYFFENKLDIKVKDKHCHPCYNDSPVYCLLSKTYSEQKVINLMLQYQEENNFKYDLCLLTRFDVVWFNKINYKEIILKNNFDKKIFLSHWNKYNSKEGQGFLDHFVIATPYTMNIYKIFLII